MRLVAHLGKTHFNPAPNPQVSGTVYGMCAHLERLHCGGGEPQLALVGSEVDRLGLLDVLAGHSLEEKQRNNSMGSESAIGRHVTGFTHRDLVRLVAQHVDLPLHVDAVDLAQEFLPKMKSERKYSALAERHSTNVMTRERGSHQLNLEMPDRAMFAGAIKILIYPKNSVGLQENRPGGRQCRMCERGGTRTAGADPTLEGERGALSLGCAAGVFCFTK
jgi:hypothetical protein